MLEDKTVLARRRPPKGLLGGMLEVPNTDWSSAAKAASYGLETALGNAPVKAEWTNKGVSEHIFTHFILKMDVFVGHTDAGMDVLEGYDWIDPAKVTFPTVFKKVLALALK